MSELTENTFTAYLGPEFQLRLMWQLLVEPEFAEKIIPDLSVEYFDDPNLRRLFLIILEFVNLYDKVPNLQNQSIHQAINLFKSPNNVIEEESLFSVISRITLWNERVLNKQIFHDGDVVQKTANNFIKQQEYRKLGEFILDKTKSGDIKHKHTLFEIDDKIQKIAHIGDDEDYGVDVTEGVENALRKEFRQTIPTGVEVLDSLTGGGLGKGEIGLILTPSGVGKTTLLTKIANTARELDYNVLQIIFEDTTEQIQRKHYTIWCETALSQIDDNNEEIIRKTNAKIESLGNKGRLIIKRFSQEDTTMKDIRNFIIRYQKKFGFKFDIVVLDYLDCLNPHVRTTDTHHAELVIVKSFEAMAGDFNIPCWSAVQSNRSGFDAELVEANQTGGNIKRVQKAHFYMSVAKTPDQKEAHLANIRIIKARFAHDGQTFKDCIFNNDTMQIIIRDDRYPSGSNKKLKKYGDEELARLEKKTSSLDLHTKISNVDTSPINDEYNNAVLKDLSDAYKTQNNIKDEFDDKIITDVVELPEIDDVIDNQIKKDDMLEFDYENKDMLIDSTKIITISNSNELPGENVESIDSSFVWTGETFTDNVNEIEVVIESITPMEIKNKVDIDVGVNQPLEVKNKNTLDIFEIESLLKNPDEIESMEMDVFDYLKNVSKNQCILKKE